MSNSCYQWVLEVVDLSTTEYSLDRFNSEFETVLPPLINKYPCLADYATFSASDTLLFNKGVGLIIASLLSNRQKAGFIDRDVIQIQTGTDKTVFSDTTNNETIPLLSEAWNYLGAISCLIDDIAEIQTAVPFLVSGKRRFTRKKLNYSTLDVNPLVQLFKDANYLYKFDGIYYQEN